MIESAENPPPLLPRSSAARTGVTTMPIRLEKEPAQIAAATLPRASEVKAIEDWTVEGTRHRKRRPV